jgi:hypothetical protein
MHVAVMTLLPVPRNMFLAERMTLLFACGREKKTPSLPGITGWDATLSHRSRNFFLERVNI